MSEVRTEIYGVIDDVFNIQAVMKLIAGHLDNTNPEDGTTVDERIAAAARSADLSARQLQGIAARLDTVAADLVRQGQASSDADRGRIIA